MKSVFRFLLIALCANTLANADNFVQTTSPKTQSNVVVKVPPLTDFDRTLQEEMKKYPRGSMFFVDGKSGKVLSVDKAPNVKSSAPNPGKFYPREADETQLPKQSDKVVPYKIQEERIDLL
ncbi:hypothetical protein [Helicobacter sp. MIT 05-5294]|uniref:hypothetical protein n=1 Tax=Helicobacter sp. MIT 05-5294 TaxID=1548150 RepID=UPI00051FB9ED|nr:hypothetical protein [Helicobacter sp. MIT 05-5294]TLD86021.1 hypothetical protein LS69_006880 [Helicobacter sp. MIT 05-5294]